MKRPELLLLLTGLLVAPLTLADSKLLATGGATQWEGQAGGGLVPWAVISGYGDTGEWGMAATATGVRVDDFDLDVAAASIGVDNRFELSYARQSLHVAPLDLDIRQDVFGAKVRLAGDIVYGNVPQLSLGLQYKRNRDFEVPSALGASDDSGLDAYLAVTRLWLDGFLGRNVFASGALRYTDANQGGLLGFGDAGGSDHSLVAEASAGLFLTRRWAIGLEYRQKPDRLDAVGEDDWRDLFVAWFPSKHVSVVAAYSDLGDIAGLADQSGWYLSLQVTP